MARFRVPVATYRLQFNSGFRFNDARALVPYLYKLGVTDFYASPRFKARPGSTHGYDVADPLRVNPELGTEEDFEKLVEELKRHGMGLVLDIVPNHMAASSENPWWMDVLENGHSSSYARYFDIDWQPMASPGRLAQETKIILPILGSSLETTLQRKEFGLRFEEGAFFVSYYDNKLPLDPKSYPLLLEDALARLRESPSPEASTLEELAAVISLARELPDRTTADPQQINRRRKQTRQLKERLEDLGQSHPQLYQALEEILQTFSGRKNDRSGIEGLRGLLAGQAYRLAYWQTALEEMNYRRFFDISHLVGLRVEDAEVFAARHAEILRLTRENRVTGLRIDHIDGLYDPLGYLRRLQRGAVSASAKGSSQNLYVIAEKILAANETLPADWPVAGTTGYDFLNAVNRSFVDLHGLQTLEKSYARFTGRKASFWETCYKRKKQVMHQLFRAETKALGDYLEMLARKDPRSPDLPRNELVRAIVEVTACLPIYRTYVRGRRVARRDRSIIKASLQAARRGNTRKLIRPAVWGFLRRLLLLESPPRGQTKDWLDFVRRWQQFTGPVMAKGLEDTSCYVHNSLLSLNEVGAGPMRRRREFGVDAFHCFNRYRARTWPHTLNATATHDTKRGEDARARLNVLSERPREWQRRLRRWSAWNRNKKRSVQGRLAPDRNEEVLLYQTLLGVWPLEEDELSTLRERLQAFTVKALREAKTHSSWLSTNPDYEKAVCEFLMSILEASKENHFLPDFLQCQRELAWPGALNSLSQLLIKITAPGIPDFYQGSELWDLSLVDPDNRRPVDFNLRARQLAELEANDSPELAEHLLARWQDGRVKQYLIWKVLNCRRNHPELFLKGDYLPLRVRGKKAPHVFAFARRYKNRWLLTVAPRFSSRLAPVGRFPLGDAAWTGTFLALPRKAPRQWTNALTGETLRAAPRGKALAVSLVLHRLPVALLCAPALARQ